MRRDELRDGADLLRADTAALYYQIRAHEMGVWPEQISESSAKDDFFQARYQCGRGWPSRPWSSRFNSSLRRQRVVPWPWGQPNVPFSNRLRQAIYCHRRLRTSYASHYGLVFVLKRNSQPEFYLMDAFFYLGSFQFGAFNHPW